MRRQRLERAVPKVTPTKLAVAELQLELGFIRGQGLPVGGVGGWVVVVVVVLGPRTFEEFLEA